MSDAADEILKAQFAPGLLWRTLALLRPHRTLFFTSLVLYVPLNLGSLLQPYLMGVMVDSVAHGGGDPHRVALLGLAYLAALLVQNAGQFVQSTMTQVLGQRMTRDLRADLFRKLQRLDASYYDRTPAGRVLTRLTSDVESLAELFSTGSATILGDLLFLGATTVVLVWTSPTLTLGGFLLLPALAVGLRLFRRAAREAFRAVRTQVARLNGFLAEHIAGMAVVQMFGQEARTAAEFDGLNRAHRDANFRSISLDAGMYAFVEAISTASVAGVLVFAADEVAGSAISLGVAVAFVDYLQRFFLPVRDLSSKYTVVQSALAAAERIFELVDEPERTANPPGGTVLRTLGTGIRFHDVHFTYPGGTRAMRGVSLEVLPGQRVALVGRTGSGKTTFTRLLLRHYDVTSGSVQVDGHDVRTLDIPALRRLVTAVPQEVHLFAGTLAENLRYGAPTATEEQLLAVLRAVQATGVLERLPGGLQGRLQERGVNLSVGERQLVAFARALLADPPCVILDEATASVDNETERRLQAATAELLRGRTAIIIAHRLATARDCDVIAVMQGGLVVERGTHAELVARDGYYARLHALQEGG
ncbi:MAG: ABC transporter ATP-binding protein [Deltaproteobacteria bacterium]|nr:ABC transporter ATP-binding protein [Deltaproteobacteria bacterium]